LATWLPTVNGSYQQLKWNAKIIPFSRLQMWYRVASAPHFNLRTESTYFLSAWLLWNCFLPWANSRSSRTRLNFFNASIDLPLYSKFLTKYFTHNAFELSFWKMNNKFCGIAMWQLNDVYGLIKAAWMCGVCVHFDVDLMENSIAFLHIRGLKC
jgi:hypothetical protein